MNYSRAWGQEKEASILHDVAVQVNKSWTELNYLAAGRSWLNIPWARNGPWRTLKAGINKKSDIPVLFCLGPLNALLCVGVSNASRLFWLYLSSSWTLHSRDPLFPSPTYSWLTRARSALPALPKTPTLWLKGSRVWKLPTGWHNISYRWKILLLVLNCYKCTYAQLLSAIQQGGPIRPLSSLSFCPWKPLRLLRQSGVLILVLCIFKHEEWWTCSI